jgi:hypothetical protein
LAFAAGASAGSSTFLTDPVGGVPCQHGADLPRHPLRCGDLVLATEMVDQRLDTSRSSHASVFRWSILHMAKVREKNSALYLGGLPKIFTGLPGDARRYS